MKEDKDGISDGRPYTRRGFLLSGAALVAAAAMPGPDEQVSFAAHIRPLFRERDRQSMSFAFGLGAYADVRTHADGIMARLADGSMPCDGAWPMPPPSACTPRCGAASTGRRAGRPASTAAGTVTTRSVWPRCPNGGSPLVPGDFNQPPE